MKDEVSFLLSNGDDEFSVYFLHFLSILFSMSIAILDFSTENTLYQPVHVNENFGMAPLFRFGLFTGNFMEGINMLYLGHMFSCVQQASWQKIPSSTSLIVCILL